MTSYGTVRFRHMDIDCSASLTSEGWHVLPRWQAIDDRLLNAVCDPADFGPADGDPMAAAVRKCARLMHGTCTLATLPGPPDGTIY